MKKTFLIISSIILSSVLVYFFFDFIQIKTTVKAVNGFNVSGWAWFGTNCINETDCKETTDPIGWISFNSNNPGIICKNISYGVNIDYKTGEISGAAFIGVGEDNNYTDCNKTKNTIENTIGWLYFDSTSTPPCGSEGYPLSYCFPVKKVGNEIQGWAPIISKDWDGSTSTIAWVRFKGSKYSVKIDDPNNSYAWSDKGSNKGFGWISFKKVNFPSLPKVINQQTSANYCNVNPGLGLITFRWEYNSSNGNKESKYEIRVNDSDDVNNPKWEKIVDKNITCIDTDKDTPISCSNTQIAYVGTDLKYGKTYYWWVKVYDETGGESGWTKGPEFGTPSYPLPFVDFSWEPTSPSLNEVVKFTNKSKCYNNAGNEVPCKNWEWTFTNGIPSSSFTQNPTSTFTQKGSQKVELKAFDSNNYKCSLSKSINITLPLPKWKEIPPMLWLRNLFANVPISLIK